MYIHYKKFDLIILLNYFALCEINFSKLIFLYFLVIDMIKLFYSLDHFPELRHPLGKAKDFEALVKISDTLKEKCLVNIFIDKI